MKTTLLRMAGIVSALWRQSRGGAGVAHRPRIRSASGLTKAQAEELLDWLEAHGLHGWEVTHEAASGFTLRRRPV